MPTSDYRPAPSKAETDTTTATNRFAGLEIQEPSQAFLDAPDAPPIQPRATERPTKVEGDDAEYGVEAMVSFMDAIFTLGNMSLKMHNLRTSVRAIWMTYQAGTIDLPAAAIGTNATVALVRVMAEEMMSKVDKYGGLDTMILKSHLFQCSASGITQAQIAHSIKTKDCLFDDDTYGIGKDGMYTVYLLVDTFRKKLRKPRACPFYHEGEGYPMFDPASQHHLKSGCDKYSDDRLLINPLLMDLFTAIGVRGLKNWQVIDELHLGMQDLYFRKKITFHFLFALQVFLDINHIFEEDIEMGFQDMRRQLEWMKSDISAQLVFHQDPHIKNHLAPANKRLRELKEELEDFLSDPVYNMQKYICADSGVPFKTSGPHRIFRRSPIISGLMLHHFRCRYKSLGLMVANGMGSIQACAHLYSALKCQKRLNQEWKDMDLVMELLGNESFFVGGKPPQDIDDQRRKYLMQMGISAAFFTKSGKNRAIVRIPKSKAGARYVQSINPVYTAFDKVYGLKEHGLLTFETLKEMIALSDLEADKLSGHVGIRMRWMVEEQTKLTRARKQRLLTADCFDESEVIDKELMSNEKQVDAVRLIEQLVYALEDEVLAMGFPYLTFHRQCWNRLQGIHTACSAKLIKAYGPNYLVDESQLPTVIGLLLELGAGGDGEPPYTKPLDDAAKDMKAWLDSGEGRAVGKKEHLGAFLGPDFGYHDNKGKNESDVEDDEEQAEEDDEGVTDEQREEAMQKLREHFEPLGVDVNKFIATYKWLKENEEQDIGWEEALGFCKEPPEDNEKN